jgi:hypothetical protein
MAENPFPPPVTDLVELERRILGSFLISNRGLKELVRIHRIATEHFIDQRHRLIWSGIIDLVMSGRIANPVTLKGWFQQNDYSLDAQYLFQLASQAITEYDRSTLIQEWLAVRPAINADWWAWYNDYLQSDDWKLKRRKVYDRCRGLCEGCRDRPVTQVHHLTYAHVGDELLYELVGLCDDCHEKAHERERS